MEKQEFKYFAFISYSSKDTEWGKRLQRKLEHYRMPATICSERGWERTPIKPVFFAPTDIQPGGLNEELQERLKSSQHLIVICSPNSAQSEWVGKEIAFFHQLGRTKQIHFFIVNGKPNSGNPETECFNPVIKTLGLQETLGANVNEEIFRWSLLNRERAYVQLISKLLQVEFDSIWQRHRRQMIQRTGLWILATILVLATIVGVWTTSQPVDVEVRLHEASAYNPNLPPMKEAIVTMTFDNEVKSDTISSFEVSTLFRNIPHHYLNEPIDVRVVCRDFLNVDTTLLLSEQITINLYRDPTVYGCIKFRLWDSAKESVTIYATLEIAGQKVTSDNDGNVSLFVPLPAQQAKYQVVTTLPLVTDTIYMPCGNDDVMIVDSHR